MTGIIDWQFVPEGYDFAAMDGGNTAGQWYIFECKPYYDAVTRRWQNDALDHKPISLLNNELAPADSLQCRNYWDK